MSEHEQRSEEEVVEEQDAIEDLDVPEEQRDDVAGGFITVRKAGKEQQE